MNLRDLEKDNSMVRSLVCLGMILLLLGSIDQTLANDQTWLPFKDGEGPCFDLHRSTVSPTNPAIVTRRVQEPLSTNPIREVITETASGRFILPVCSWKNDEWKQHAIGTAIFTLHIPTASAISLRLGHDLPVSIPFGKGQPDREFVTLEHVEIKKGAKEVRIHIIARDSGPLGIVKAGEISVLGTSPLGVSSVRNDHPTALPEQK